ncbi:MAG: 23S rRNA (adenine(2503)-C(2))-methyltransferase RlmN [Myxococcales bacterium]|nr:MAG: 23S rRNA (adenine(2503)-C(2))-methyltransferase RlmN [Myxococcales bacterium]
MARIPIHSLTNTELRKRARELLPRGHGFARRVHRRAMLEGRFEPERFGLGPEACAAWASNFSFDLPDIVAMKSDESEHGATSKMVLRLDDGLEAESVCIPMGRDRYTLCVSSQVGCKMGCAFCETGRMGLLRHLRTEEIIAQVLVAKHRLGWPIRNIVFMGMGEALDNADHVIQAIRVLNDEAGLAIGQERLTICTAGHVEGIRALDRQNFKRLNLSISLNAANDSLRSEIMPVNRRTNLAELQDALKGYRPRRNFALGVNYCLLPGINDTQEDARGVADLCGPLGRVLVNVIPYNPGTKPLTRAPEEAEVEQFIAWLRAEGLPVRERVTKGRSVMAACGQLGNPEARRKRAMRESSSSLVIPRGHADASGVESSSSLVIPPARPHP